MFLSLIVEKKERKLPLKKEEERERLILVSIN
jgi:hypothetical protein